MAEQTLHSERIYDGKVVKLRVDRVRMDGGREVQREVVEHAGAVAIVPIDADGRVLLVRQYRTPAGRALLEAPAGGLDADEQPEAAAQRELQEETGYRAATIRRLAGFYTAPGYSTEFIHVYLAEGLSESKLAADDDEQIEVERHTLAEALAMIADGRICDAKSIIGLLAFARLRPSASA
ncbi:MAG TPA: NUDIX hydrolase [Dehalococcoidia bacterium]|nr:NUDIX hydrolase [Dehalococcoidia bacterium]